VSSEAELLEHFHLPVVCALPRFRRQWAQAHAVPPYTGVSPCLARRAARAGPFWVDRSAWSASYWQRIAGLQAAIAPCTASAVAGRGRRSHPGPLSRPFSVTVAVSLGLER
jgi:hypothetical protein